MFALPKGVQSPKVEFDKVTKENAQKFFRNVDFDSSQEFAHNYGGHPRSDVALINEQSDVQAALALADRLIELPQVQNDLPDDLKLSRIKSKYQQSPAEMIEYYDRLLAERDRKEMDRLSEEEKAKHDKDVSDRRRALLDSLSEEEKQLLSKMRRTKDIESLI